MAKLSDSTRKMITNVTACTSVVVGGFVGGIISSIARNSNPITKLIANVSGIAIGYTVAESVYTSWAPLICETVNDIINLKEDADDNPDIQKDSEKEKIDKTVAEAVEKIRQRTQQMKESEKAYVDVFASSIKAGTLPKEYITGIIGNCDECPASETIDKDSVDISDITKE